MYLHLAFFMLLGGIQMLNAQVSGYQGKHFILKTDMMSPILEKGCQTELEWVWGRRISLSIAYKYANHSYIQELAEYYTDFGKYPDEKAQMKSQNITLNTRIYLNKAYNAPLGKYVYLQHSLGQANISALDYTSGKNEVSIYQIDKVLAQHHEFGLGFQHIFFGKICLDIATGLNLGGLSVKGYDSYIQDINEQFGPNIIKTSYKPRITRPLSRWFGLDNRLGFSSHLSLGLLLF